MDGSATAWVWELVKTVVGFYLIYITKDWFGAGKIFSVAPYIVGIYLLATLIGSIYFSKQVKR